MQIKIVGNKLIFIFVVINSFILCGHAQKIDFKIGGELIVSKNLNELEQVIKSGPIKVFEPHQEINITYVGFPLEKILSHTSIYQTPWKQFEEVVFECSDGYQASIPIGEFAKFDSYLVFKRKDGKKFAVENKRQNEKNVELGPYYLVWDNLSSRVLKKEGASYWPYQVVAINLIYSKQKYPKLAPASDATTSVKEGYLHFRKYCFSCHAIEEEGGKKGPDLFNVTSRYDRKWLTQFISDPRSLRPESNMAKISFPKKRKVQIINEVLDFLESKRKK